MLILSRKLNEEIRIDGDITLKVIEIRHDKVRIGIDAPKEVQIYRSEVLERMNTTTSSRTSVAKADAAPDKPVAHEG